MPPYAPGDRFLREDGTICTITEICPLGQHITGGDPVIYVRLRPGLDYTVPQFEAALGTMFRPLPEDA